MSVKGIKRGKEDNANKKAVANILKGSAVGSAAFFLLLLMFASVILRFDIDSSVLAVFAFASAAIAAFISGFAAVRPTRKKGILAGALSVLPILILITVISAITCGSPGQNMLIAAAVMIAGGAAGGISAVNMRRKKSKR
ncbi:MAG: TIGR04086 family membrane protein [Clostridiales bacterium]|jgi:putative membrane protein (TIGR04086 family)|nr:TIGR04086 family membrane protein [Clostridiales bacterium]